MMDPRKLVVGKAYVTLPVGVASSGSNRRYAAGETLYYTDVFDDLIDAKCDRCGKLLDGKKAYAFGYNRDPEWKSGGLYLGSECVKKLSPKTEEGHAVFMSSMRALFEKYEYRGSVAVPDAKHVAVANKREADRDADRKRREADPSDPRNKRIAAIEANQTEWTKLEGIDVLAVPNPKSLLVAVPTSGKKSSKTFEVMPRNPPRSVLAVLDKAEVNGWLVKAFVDGNEEVLIRNAG